jgi:hypothetical protein
MRKIAEMRALPTSRAVAGIDTPAEARRQLKNFPKFDKYQRIPRESAKPLSCFSPSKYFFVSISLCMQRHVSTNLGFSVSAFLLLVAVWGFWACDSRSQWEKENAELHRQMTDLEHRQKSLQASIDSLWDITSAQLAAALPAGFPPTDRDIFLNARNADHIRMFMSFKLLDADAQSLVNQAGEQDEILAAQARALLEERQAFEQHKNQFLQKVAAEDESAGRLYASKFRSATSGI